MAGSLVVVGYRDGRRVKGTTFDFLPGRDAFHVQTDEHEVIEVRLRELKSVFFVRDLAGDPAHRETNEFNVNSTMTGRRIRIEYEDGEELVGTTQGYSPERPGFFVVPADRESNNQRVFVVAAATRDVRYL